MALWLQVVTPSQEFTSVSTSVLDYIKLLLRPMRHSDSGFCDDPIRDPPLVRD